MPTQRLHRRPASPPAACSLVREALKYCAGPIDVSPASEAACLCYNSQDTITSWVPNLFDGNILTCTNYFMSSYSTIYLAYQPLGGSCKSIGDVSWTPATTAAANTDQPTVTDPISVAATTTGSYYPPCITVVDIIISCIEATGILTNGDKAVLATCAYYSNEVWEPSDFDDQVLSCANYLKTVNSSGYPLASNSVGFCTNYGGEGLISQTSATSTPLITSPSKTTVIIYTPATSSISAMTFSVKPGADSSLAGSVFGKWLWALAVVGLGMDLLL